MKKFNWISATLLSILIFLTGCENLDTVVTITPYPIIAETEFTPITETSIAPTSETIKSISTSPQLPTLSPMSQTSESIFNISSVPDYSGIPYVSVNDNIPYFTNSEHTTESFEIYTPLDNLGRCGKAFASVGVDIMPTEERGTIGQVKPSGWNTIRYEFIDGKYLYNRCHLIGYQLSGENSNTQNLITGTRYMNMEGMLPFENLVADYVKETNNHVLYRVTPIFEGNNLLSTGVLMEGLSMEDGGTGVCFNVFCYNVQPGIHIDYATGKSSAVDVSVPYGSSVSYPQEEQENILTTALATTYIGNKNTKKFHYPSCRSVTQMK